MSESAAAPTVVCYARPAQLAAPIDRQIETLQRCAADGYVETLLVRTWPATLSVTDSPPNSEALATFERFRAWADRAGVSICPPFEQVTRTSTITGEHQELLRTPRLCLAVYADGQLTAVYPHSDGAHTHSVTDVIDTLRTSEGPARGGAARPPAPTPMGSCPKCGASCHSGQGVYACPDCRWVAGTTGDGHYHDLPALQLHWAATAAWSQPHSAPR